ncbi:hypothetical protein EW145_g3345 [Phellinidium pouzarii]|uniref:Uncharacterized protein n=1 Tax=Phellinidium pouzarii TaxID=167371 RepID=A0A4S4L7V1_9AGAM|nr:hypothetical protein EW145_g3345 [Phellinidium pouzarii]
MSSAPRSTHFKNLFSTITSSSPTPTNSANHPKKLTPEEHEKCMKEGHCLASTIHQVTPDLAPAPPTPAAAEPAKPTLKANIIAHIRSLLQNARDNVAVTISLLHLITSLCLSIHLISSPDYFNSNPCIT